MGEGCSMDTVNAPAVFSFCAKDCVAEKTIMLTESKKHPWLQAFGAL